MRRLAKAQLLTGGEISPSVSFADSSLVRGSHGCVGKREALVRRKEGGERCVFIDRGKKTDYNHIRKSITEFRWEYFESKGE